MTAFTRIFALKFLKLTLKLTKGIPYGFMGVDAVAIPVAKCECMNMNKPVILKLEGGLGNQLFEFAAGYYLAAKLDTDLVLDQFGIPLTNHGREQGLGFGAYEWPLINGRHNLVTLPEVISASTMKLAKKSSLFEKGILKYRLHASNIYQLPIYRETENDSDFFDIDHSVKLHGNFQSWKIVEEASKFGFPRVFSLKETDGWVSKFTSSTNLKSSLAIHFRLGQDSLDNIEFSQPSAEYYLKAIELLSFEARPQDIYVFSDDIDLAKERYSHLFGDRCHFISPPTSESPAQKQFVLSQFGALICANSTFCSWAGWTIANNGGQVVVPVPFSDSQKKGSRDFPKTWTKLSKFSGDIVTS